MLILCTGLSVAESSKLCNYMHFREPVVLNQKPLLQRANLDKAIDFMDNLEEDIPRGMHVLVKTKFKQGKQKKKKKKERKSWILYAEVPVDWY